MLPALSVVTTRRSYWPSACSVVFQLAVWFVQVPAPIGERWKVTVAMPEPPSAELLVSEIVLRTLAASAGAVIEPVGFVLSTRTCDRGRGDRVAGVVGRDDAEVVLAVGLQGRCSSSAAWFVHVPAPIGERWN